MIVRAGILVAGLFLVQALASTAAASGASQGTRLGRGTRQVGMDTSLAPLDTKSAVSRTSGPHLRFRGNMCLCGHGPSEKDIEAALIARRRRASKKSHKSGKSDD